LKIVANSYAFLSLVGDPAMGIIVIQSIANGLTLIDLSSSLRYMVTGAVLAIAVIVDSLARRSRMSHGRA